MTDDPDTAEPGPGPEALAPHPDSTAAAPHPDCQAYDRRMLEALVCPATRAPLAFDRQRQELVSRAAHLAYPIRDGIPIMLVHEAREID